MFTIKYLSYRPSATQSDQGPTNYDRCEQLHGPFALVSQEMDDGHVVVYAHRSEDAPGMTFGPNKGPDETGGENRPPHSSLWVMNERGATVASYVL